MSNKNMEVVSDKRGLIRGYKPNRITLYILMLSSGRYEELMDVFYKDMEEYKTKEDNNEER